MESMLTLPIATLIARDVMRRQFTAPRRARPEARRA
jgi:hypothetical protein